MVSTSPRRHIIDGDRPVQSCGDLFCGVLARTLVGLAVIAVSVTLSIVLSSTVNQNEGAVAVPSEATICTACVDGLSCWDLNANGKCDLTTEDINNDGTCDADDCRGTRGLPGQDCQPCVNGTQGPVGPRGFNGSDGAQGPQGPQGAVGPQGPAGQNGSAGINGTNGIHCWDLNGNGVCDLVTEDRNSDGACNVTDCRGDVGAQGPQGPAGQNGSAGINGTNGIHCWDLNGNGVCNLATEDRNGDGVCNVTDCRGDVGATGAQGPQGPAGQNGSAGINGTNGIHCWDLNGNGACDLLTEDRNSDGVCNVTDCRGDVGATGAQGPQGPAGQNGSAGLNGTNGINCWDLNGNGICDALTEDRNGDGVCNVTDCRGDVGATGAQGPQGTQGVAGQNGTNGLNCWDLNGNGVCDVLTEDRNSDGVCNATDCRGDVGATGATGPQGPAGLNGTAQDVCGTVCTELRVKESSTEYQMRSNGTTWQLIQANTTTLLTASSTGLTVAVPISTPGDIAVVNPSTRPVISIQYGPQSPTTRLWMTTGTPPSGWLSHNLRQTGTSTYARDSATIDGIGFTMASGIFSWLVNDPSVSGTTFTSDLLAVAARLTPSSGFRIFNTGTAESTCSIRTYANRSVFAVETARGVRIEPLGVLSGTDLGGLEARAAMDISGFGTYPTTGSAAVAFVTTEDHTTTARGTSIVLRTTPNGATTMVDRLTIQANGTVNVAGAVNAATGSFSGAVTAGAITGSSLSISGTASTGALTAPSVNGGALNGSSLSVTGAVSGASLSISGLSSTARLNVTTNATFFGNVGIGTAVPSVALEISNPTPGSGVGGLLQCTNPGSAPSGSTISLSSPSGDPGIILIRGNGTGGTLRRFDMGVSSAQSFYISTSSGRMTMESSGSVVVGATSAFNLHPFSVQGNVSGRLLGLNQLTSGDANIEICRAAGTTACWQWYIPSGSTDMRLYSGTSGNLGDRITVTAAGKIGFGISSIASNSKFHFYDASDSSTTIEGGHADLFMKRSTTSFETMIRFQTGGVDDFMLGMDNSGGTVTNFQMKRSNNAAPDITVDSSTGNVGISQSTNINNRLEVSGAMRVSGSRSTTASGAGLEFGYESSQGVITSYNRAASTYQSLRVDASQNLLYAWTSDTYLINVANQPMYFFTNNAERMRISGGGNVGVGTGSDLNNKLEVGGGFRVQGQIAGGTGAGIEFDYSAGAGTIQVYERSPGNVWRWMHLKASGIQAFAQTSTAEIGTAAANSNWVGLTVGGTVRVWTSNSFMIPVTAGAMNLGGSSNQWNVVYALTPTINTSDRRRKQNITATTLGLRFIRLLKPVSYVFRPLTQNVTEKVPVNDSLPANDPAQTFVDANRTVTDNPKRRHEGLIAQDVFDAMTELNVTANDFAGYVDPAATNETGFLGLRYEEFIGPVIRAVQEVDERVTALEALLALMTPVEGAPTSSTMPCTPGQRRYDSEYSFTCMYTNQWTRSRLDLSW